MYRVLSLTEKHKFYPNFQSRHRSMKNLFGVDLGRLHYRCMINLLGAAGKNLNDAVELINQMQRELVPIAQTHILNQFC